MGRAWMVQDLGAQVATAEAQTVVSAVHLVAEIEPQAGMEPLVVVAAAVVVPAAAWAVVAVMAAGAAAVEVLDRARP